MDGRARKSNRSVKPSKISRGTACCAPSRQNVKCERTLFGLGFFFDDGADVGDDVAKYFDGDVVLANRFDWVGELHLALVNFEALRRDTCGDVAGRDRSEHLIVLAGLALEVERNAGEQLRLLLCGLE